MNKIGDFMNLKKQILAIALIAFTCINATELTYTPANTEIFWDIHHVIIKKKGSEILKTLYNAPKIALLSNLFNWTLLKDMFALRGSTGGAYMQRLKQEDQRLADFALNMANSQVMINGMEDLILDLANQGYTMHVASNIGSEVYEHLKNKFPHIFNENVIKDGKTVDFKSENPVEKPHAQFFIELSSLRNKNKQHALFIDDKQENVDAANANGFIGILFKNAQQLKQELKK
ncbi:MAG: HAD hydrolase-like protein [Candidatus Dependentiae bacterium]